MAQKKFFLYLVPEIFYKLLALAADRVTADNPNIPNSVKKKDEIDFLCEHLLCCITYFLL